MAQEENVRKGPWTEQEDLQLVYSVAMFGDRRWDSIAKVSGLKRTGKSCRLRWVNYLHPGLKTGKMTPQEERLVLELQAKWGNRWSRIARKLPGRTDNEIKNYWRTHMRKKAQEMKTRSSSSSPMSPPSSSSNCCSSASTNPTVDSLRLTTSKAGEESFYDTGGKKKKIIEEEEEEKGVNNQKGNYNYVSMDDIWKDIEDYSAVEKRSLVFDDLINGPPISVEASPSCWGYCPDSLWRIDEDVDNKMFVPHASDHHEQHLFTSSANNNSLARNFIH